MDHAGNHHDGWVFGAADPMSGHIAMMGEAEGNRRPGAERLAAKNARSSI